MLARRAFGVIIDEAQSMPDELMEEVRLLANVEIAGERCLSIVLTVSWRWRHG